MKNSYLNILREPDSVLFRYDDSNGRFEEPDSREEQTSKISTAIVGDSLRVTLYPSERRYNRVKLRWNGDLSDVQTVCGDDVARYLVESPWTALMPQKPMPWYFHTYDGERLSSYGVKTGPNAFCFFMCDESGISLWIDVRNGGLGAKFTEPLDACDIVCDEGDASENPYISAQKFCRRMCEKPRLLDEPVFGVNNWYWAYGNITHDTIMTETDQLMDMCRDAKGRPYMIIDDGWQLNRYSARTSSYNGGPWDKTNANFESMAKTADAIHAKGAKAGIWYRPLLTCLPTSVPMQSHVDCKNGIILDPSHPEVLAKVAEDTKLLVSWGYEMLKHDFTTIDTMGANPAVQKVDYRWQFYDNTITNAQMLKRLYQVIQDAAGDTAVIGCNTINHLVAGIHAIQRSGGDTSGRTFEITRRYGLQCMVRQPQDKAFFHVDPDCAAFTDMVDHDINLDFLEMAAVTGVVTLASVTPGALTPDEMKRIRGIYKIASEGGRNAIPDRWVNRNVPSHFIAEDGEKFAYDWYRCFGGNRLYYTWNY